MIKVSYLIWTFLSAVLVSSLSYFYTKDGLTHGFPFTIATDRVVNNTYNGVIIRPEDIQIVKEDINFWLFALDVLFWWILFSILLVMVKNYVFER